MINIVKLVFLIQEVLKELLEEYCPEIANHLASLDIELASITLNWFIALFFDAVPFSVRNFRRMILFVFK